MSSVDVKTLVNARLEGNNLVIEIDVMKMVEHIMREQAEKLAAELGLDPGDVKVVSLGSKALMYVPLSKLVDTRLQDVLVGTNIKP